MTHWPHSSARQTRHLPIPIAIIWPVRIVKWPGSPTRWELPEISCTSITCNVGRGLLAGPRLGGQRTSGLCPKVWRGHCATRSPAGQVRPAVQQVAVHKMFCQSVTSRSGI